MMYIKNTFLFVAAITLLLFFGCKKNVESNTQQEQNANTTISSRVDTSLYTITGNGGGNPGEILLALNASLTQTHALAIRPERLY